MTIHDSIRFDSIRFPTHQQMRRRRKMDMKVGRVCTDVQLLRSAECPHSALIPHIQR
jgi:hypothetical protein